MISELDKIWIKLVIPVTVIVAVSYLVYDEEGMLIAAAVLLSIFVGISAYFLFETYIPPRKAIIKLTDGNCKVHIECSEFYINRKPLLVAIDEKEIVATLFRGSKITLNLSHNDRVCFLYYNNVKSSSYDVENDMRLYVWIEPSATVQIQVEKFYTAPSKNSAYNIYKKTNQFVRKITIPIIIFGIATIIMMLWHANIFQ